MSEPPFAVELSLVEFRQALFGLPRDFRGFLVVRRSWSDRLAPDPTDAFVARFGESFEVSQPRDSEA
jgi:hypothetical protein